MSKKIEKLVAVEYDVTEESTYQAVGDKYVWLQDPATLQYYSIRPGVVLEGLDFEALFVRYQEEG